ncbi:hypothetical protein C8F04DRAFT_1257074 [Mycena alexandri]|uniref:Uncharacterized protein n=1 Tax=Mycena alexandri TaxID=1745969 RepID=A0AAD6T191_9AGAR|nr:hypothetical protein C8F04DRAFT_1257074 [Mycena alexandri]
MNNFLIEHFTTAPGLRPKVVELRDTSASSREARSIKKTVEWVTEIGDLAREYPTIDVTHAPEALQGKKIFGVNWQVVVGRSPTYYKKALDASKILESCRDQSAIIKYIGDEATKTSIDDLIEGLKQKRTKNVVAAV